MLRLTEFEFRRLIERRERKTPRPRLTGRRWEVEFAAQLDAAGYAGCYRREYRFQDDRRFRFDFAFVPEMVAVEIDGAVHRIKKRFHADMEKGTLALLGGWRVLHVSPKQVRDGDAIGLLTRLLVP